MKPLLGAVLSCILMVAPAARGEQTPRGVTLIELLARPEAFDGKLVTVRCSSRGLFLDRRFVLA